MQQTTASVSGLDRADLVSRDISAACAVIDISREQFKPGSEPSRREAFEGSDREPIDRVGDGKRCSSPCFVSISASYCQFAPPKP